MQGTRNRPRPRLHIPDRKHVEFVQSPCLGGTLTPDLPHSPPVFPSDKESGDGVLKVDRYLLLNLIDTQGQVKIYKAFHSTTHVEYLCKALPLDIYRDSLNAYLRVGSHAHINELVEVVVGKSEAYFFFEQHFGDLHTYVRTRKRLREPEVGRLFAQIVSAVDHCHQNGIVLRDFKLRKFVFKDQERTELKLVGLEDACVLGEDDDDRLLEKHGCPAYVSPEILTINRSYSGRAADVWSLGVMLYTMLIGRYPFHDREPSALFTRIRRGDFCIPDTISSRAKCLIRCLLRHEPAQRLAASDILQHPWFNSRSRIHGYTSSKHDAAAKLSDHVVPSMPADASGDELFI